jgi:hypothetical protein
VTVLSVRLTLSNPIIAWQPRSENGGADEFARLRRMLPSLTSTNENNLDAYIAGLDGQTLEPPDRFPAGR